LKKSGDYLLPLNLFDDESLTSLEINVTKYVNKNVECIIKVLIDYLEDDNGFTPDDFLPRNNLRIDNDAWYRMVRNLYDIVHSDVIRDDLKPTYKFLLYIILQWWEDCADDSDELLNNKLDDILAGKIEETYTSQDGANYVLNSNNTYPFFFLIMTFCQAT